MTLVPRSIKRVEKVEGYSIRCPFNCSKIALPVLFALYYNKIVNYVQYFNFNIE